MDAAMTDQVQPPPGDAPEPTPLERANDQAMMAPEKPTQYALPSYPGAPTLSLAELEQSTQGAHAVGIPAPMFASMVSAIHFAERDEAAGMSRDATYERTERELRRRWGDQFDARAAAAQGVARDLVNASPYWRQKLAGAAAGNSIHLAEVLAAFGEYRAQKKR